MNESPPGTETEKKRSYGGCTRCKRRRQKCDERRPSCGRCKTASISCDYVVQLRWGGRTFNRSRFGECLKGDVVKIGQSTNEFVYASSPLPLASLARGNIELLPQEIGTLSWLSAIDRGLLHHYTVVASRISSCHSHIQLEICRLVVPLAFEFPALLNATLAWSALHRVALGGGIEGIVNPSDMIRRLKTNSLDFLRRELQDFRERDYGHISAIFATVRILCQCEIHSGSDEGSAWRVHITGAKALINAIPFTPLKDRGLPRLLHRWYTSLDSLAELASSHTRELDEKTHRGYPECHSYLDGRSDFEPYLDDYNGYSTDLSSLLGEIGSIVAVPADTHDLALQADLLEARLDHIMQRDNTATPVFYPGVEEKLSPQAIQEYSFCNQAYQQTALIHIQRRLRNLPSNSFQVQHSVKIIIDCARSITLTYGMSPAIVMTTPIFTAGCEALGEDRVAVKELLLQYHSMLKIRNIHLTLEILECLWENDDGNGDWQAMLREKKWDFIPY